MIIVGCSIAPEYRNCVSSLDPHRRLAPAFIAGSDRGRAAGSRALKPVDAISATAAKIAAGDLSQRINVAEAEANSASSPPF